MKLKFSKKAGIFTFFGIVAVSAVTGYMLDNANHYFTIDKIDRQSKTENNAVEKTAAVKAVMLEETLLPNEASEIDEAVTDNTDKTNINTADAEALEALDGVGPSLAERIIKYREKHGGFDSIEELVNVSGVGKKKLDAIREDICVE